MPRLRKGIIFGVVTAAVGLLLGLSPPGHHLEESLGLDVLFALRGTRKPPPEVVIIALDHESSRNLNQPEDPRGWERSIHAKLTSLLKEFGARVIVFDITFETPQSIIEDYTLASAIRNAANVIVCEKIEVETVRVDSGAHGNIEKRIVPIPIIEQCAAALAPHPIPIRPPKVKQFWTFRDSVFGSATLPIVSFQLYALPIYLEFMDVLKEKNPDLAAKLPGIGPAQNQKRTIGSLIDHARVIFEGNGSLVNDLLGILDDPSASSMDAFKKQILRSLFKMYQSSKSLYLNFYGPPGTVETISYYRLLEAKEQKSIMDDYRVKITNKAVFIGFSELLRPDKRDRYLTVYSLKSGVDLSGVELAATAFANLLEDKPLRPVSDRFQIAFLVFWGLLIGTLCRFLPTCFSCAGVAGLAVVYGLIALHRFKSGGIWYPLAVPLFIQLPLAFFGTVLWKYSDTQKERQYIRKAFGYYIPNSVVDQLARSMGDVQTSRQPVYGTCLFTDAGQYTRLSEKMEPKKLSEFMNRYYEMLFEPVKRYGGIVINVVGDSMLAVWTSPGPDIGLRNKACLAALDIDRTVRQFNRSLDGMGLPIRIGLHSGHMLLASVGAIDHYEYRPVGDIVNTASRMEGLNKLLGTRILVSRDVVHQLDGLRVRALGKFLFLGKTTPVEVYELIPRQEACGDPIDQISALFAAALRQYVDRSFEAGLDAFTECLKVVGDDGPSRFYLERCRQYLEKPPEEPWDGVVRLDAK